MKHKKLERIWWSVLGNGIFFMVVWFASWSPIWKETRDGDFWIKLFAVIGMAAVFGAINYFIELNTRVKNKGD